MAKALQEYEAEGITVGFDPNLCTHSGVCVRGLPEVFDVKRRDWIRAYAAPVETIVAQVERCPSGALQYARSSEIAELEAELRRAQLDGDVAALDRLISDNLLFAGPDGALATKQQDLEAHRTGVIRFREHEPEELRIRRVGSHVAIVSLRTRLAVEVNGTLTRGTFRYTRVWARHEGEPWRVVGGQVSAITR